MEKSEPRGGLFIEVILAQKKYTKKYFCMFSFANIHALITIRLKHEKARNR
jgi:hypothetical protein